MQNINLLSQDSDLSTRSANLESVDHARDGGAIVDLGTADPNDSIVLAEINTDPLKRRIADPRPRGIIPYLWHQVKNYIHPPMTAAERAALDEAKAVKLLDKVLAEEAETAARRISRALHNLGYSHVRRGADGEIKKATFVSFDMAVSTEDAHWLHINMDSLPYGVNSSDLCMKQEVIDHLGKSVGHKVNVRASDEAGIWYIIERASGMMGLPVYVKYNDMLEQFPTSSNGLTIPLGMTSNRKRVYEDLDDMVHILVAGETGGGKSNTQSVFIATLAMRNSPEQIQLLLLDMKAGMEFQFYEGLPHLLPIPDVTSSGIIEDPDQVYPAFQWLLNREAKRRMSIIRGANHRSISDYNVRRKHPMPRLVVVCDEWGTARLSNNGKEAEVELAKAVMLLRAAGIHIIIGTQTPTKEVLGLLVRSNLPTKIAHNCNEFPASAIIVGDGSALGLPVGRGIYKRSGQKFPIQFPRLTEQMIKEIVENIKSGKSQAAPTKTHDVTTDELLVWGLHNNGGGLNWRDLYKAFDHRGITADEVKAILKDLDGKEIVIEEKVYTVEPGAGQKPRRLVAVEQGKEVNQDENS